MPYDPREIENVKKKQRKATGNVVTNVQSPNTDESEGLTTIAKRTGVWGTPLEPIEFPPGSGEYPGYTGGAEDTGIPQRVLDLPEADIDEVDYAMAQDALDHMRTADSGSFSIDEHDTALENLDAASAQALARRDNLDLTDIQRRLADLKTYGNIETYRRTLEQLRREAPHVQEVETPKLEPKSASTTAPHYAETWSIGKVDAPVLPGFEAPKTFTWTDATGITTESPVWTDVWQMNDMFDPHDIKATLNIQGKPVSVDVGTRFDNGDEVTDIELAPVRVGPGEGQEIGVWRIRMTPEGEDVQDYFVYSEDVDASQIVEGGEAATSRASEKEAARKKAEADAAAAAAEVDTATTRDDLLAEVWPDGLKTDLPGGRGKGDLRYTENIQSAYDKTLKETGDEQAALDAAHGARNASAVSDLEKYSESKGVKSITSKDDPFERILLNDDQLYIKSPEGLVYNVSDLNEQEIYDFYTVPYDDQQN